MTRLGGFRLLGAGVLSRFRDAGVLHVFLHAAHKAVRRVPGHLSAEVLVIRGAVQVAPKGVFLLLLGEVGLSRPVAALEGAAQLL